MKSQLTCAAACLLALMACAAHAQSAADLKNDAVEPNNVLTYGMGYNAQRFSPLTQINKRNVARLTPVWALGIENDYGEIGQPMVMDGIMFVADAKWTIAIDAVTGKMLWRDDVDFDPDSPRSACCGVTYRGVALYEGMVFRGTLDGYMIALDQKTGKRLWKTQVADWKERYTITVAPIVANGVLITGIAGADRATRCFLDGYDPKTGKKLWRRWTTAAPGEPGGETWPVKDSYLLGGGSTWTTGSYDPDLDLVYWGTGNASPFNPTLRGGNSLFTASVIAIRPTTGEMVWYYQFTPQDMYDYDTTGEMTLADVRIDGKLRKVLMHLDKNGFAYVLDRTDGKLLAANPFAVVNWASAIDLKTGMPIETDLRTRMLAGETLTLRPSFSGARNWNHAAYLPSTGLLYLNTLNLTSTYSFAPLDQVAKVDGSGSAAGRTGGIRGHQYRFVDGEPKGRVEAIDPFTGKAKWSHPLFDHPNGSSMLATATGLLFTGRHNREFIALDADTGKQLWSFTVTSGVNSSPITWAYKGRQYVSVQVGLGANGSRWMGEERKAVPVGGSVWTFALPQ